MAIIDPLFKELKKIMADVVIKYDRLAKANETVDSIRESDLYLSAIRGIDSFNTYQFFDIDALTRAGVNDIALAQKYSIDKYLIPDDQRGKIVEAQRRFIINNYEEKNNYYRMLMGLPNYEDDDFVYVSKEIYDEFELDPKIPIHELNEEVIDRLHKTGEMNSIISKYKGERYNYLKFLGSKKIDLVAARTARPFTILRLNKDMDNFLYQDFSSIYEQCREYTMSVIYIAEYGKRYDMYDNFIAMSIMIMAIQKIISNTYKYGISLDFYNASSIKDFFDSYNVPFLSELPLEQLRLLARNLNLLLRFKSTDKVLYDLCSLLGFERVNIYKYYLVKDHKRDRDGNPLFAYKEVTDDEGVVSVVEDCEKMYDLYFQKVEMNERNLALALTESSNKMSYNEVVLDDPYWWDEDGELKQYLYKSEYNYAETKYMNMNIMYKLTEMLFEVIYIFRMIVDRRKDTELVEITLPKLFGDEKFNFFSITMFLCALIAKKNNLRGEIITSPTKSLTILGFNFKRDLNKIRDFVRQNSKYIDQKVLKYISNMDINSAKDINNLFYNIRELNDFIVGRLGDTKNIDEYVLYKKLFNALYITEQSETIYKKSDGTIATTFMDFLRDDEPKMAEFVTLKDNETIIAAIDHVLAEINKKISELKYLYILNDSNKSIIGALTKLINFFKSYTTEFTSFNIIYLMNSRHYNMAKVISDLESITATFEPKEKDLIMQYKDTFFSKGQFSVKDKMKLVVAAQVFAKISLREDLDIRDKLQALIAELRGKDLLTNYDIAHMLYANILIKSEKIFKNEWSEILSSILGESKLNIYDKLQSLGVELKKEESMLLYGLIKSLDGEITIKDKSIFFKEWKDIVSYLTINDKLNVKDELERFIAELERRDVITIYDNTSSLSEIRIKEEDSLISEWSEVLTSILGDNKLNIYDKLQSIGMELKRREPLLLYDLAKSVYGKAIVKDKSIFFKEWKDIVSYLTINDKLNVKDELERFIAEFIRKDVIAMYDNALSSSEISVREKDSMISEWFSVIQSMSFEDKSYLSDKLQTIGIELKRLEPINFFDVTTMDTKVIPKVSLSLNDFYLLYELKIVADSKLAVRDDVNLVESSIKTKNSSKLYDLSTSLSDIRVKTENLLTEKFSAEVDSIIKSFDRTRNKLFTGPNFDEYRLNSTLKVAGGEVTLKDVIYLIRET